jgi:hypothetical protein
LAIISGLVLALGLHSARGESRPDETQTSVCLMLEAAARGYELPLEYFARLIWRESRFQAHAIGPRIRSGLRAKVGRCRPTSSKSEPKLGGLPTATLALLEPLKKRIDHGVQGYGALCVLRIEPCTASGGRANRAVLVVVPPASTAYEVEIGGGQVTNFDGVHFKLPLMTVGIDRPDAIMLGG